MKHLRSATTLTLSLLALSVSAQSRAPLTVPYTASAEVQAEVETADSWMEVYEVAPSEVTAAVQALTEQSVVPTTVAVGFTSGLHLRINKKPAVLEERSFETRRGSQAIAYDLVCTVVPQVGDIFEASYSNDKSKASATLNLKVLEQYAFKTIERIGLPDELARVTMSAGGDCSAVTESRVLFTGSMDVVVAKQPKMTIPVLVQVVYLKP